MTVPIVQLKGKRVSQGRQERLRRNSPLQLLWPFLGSLPSSQLNFGPLPLQPLHHLHRGALGSTMVADAQFPGGTSEAVAISTPAEAVEEGAVGSC